MDAYSKPKRLVVYGRRAALDLEDNHEHTAAHWGNAQADRYTQFLIDTAQEAADGEAFSKPVQGHEPTRYVFAKWPKARHGHNIFFRTTEEGIFVLRVLHSSMDSASHLRHL